MTKEQVIELAKQAGFDLMAENPKLVKFFTLVRNAAVIEERKALAEVCDAMGSPNIAEYLREQAAAIESLKEPTP